MQNNYIDIPNPQFEGEIEVFLYVLRRDKPPTQEQMARILDAFRKSRGGEVIMLGGQAVVGDLPREPDMYVVMTCIRVCAQKNITFDPKRDRIAYMVGFDPVENEETGVCEIFIHG